MPSRAVAVPLPSLHRAPQRSICAAEKAAPPESSGGVRQRLVQLMARLRPGGGGSWSLTPRQRRLVALLTRLRPFVPILLAIALAARRMSRNFVQPPRPTEVAYSAFMSLAGAKWGRSSLTNLRLSPTRYTFLLDGRPAFTRPPRAPPDVISFLHRHGVDFAAAPVSGAAPLLPLIFPCLWLAAVYSMMRRQMGGTTGSVGKKASTSLRLSAADLSFDDVAGIDTAKAEVREIVTMLKSPGKFAAAGARLPSGVLMAGPPGTGKTLLARVMAAQAGVPFFYCSGSDFVELFVGRGAARMRALFKEAEAAAPCLIFVDELDALGKQRSLRIANSNDEVEQTLNQMLACMDGLETSNNGVVVMGATNRYEILDPALTRPGRFDRLVRVAMPDEAGRLAILKVHTRKLQLGPSVNLNAVAAATGYYSGADLAALANEAAIRAVRRSSVQLCQDDFLEAVAAFSSARNRLPGLPNVDELRDGLLGGMKWPNMKGPKGAGSA